MKSMTLFASMFSLSLVVLPLAQAQSMYDANEYQTVRAIRSNGQSYIEKQQKLQTAAIARAELFQQLVQHDLKKLSSLKSALVQMPELVNAGVLVDSLNAQSNARLKFLAEEIDLQNGRIDLIKSILSRTNYSISAKDVREATGLEEIQLRGDVGLRASEDTIENSNLEFREDAEMFEYFSRAFPPQKGVWSVGSTQGTIQSLDLNQILGDVSPKCRVMYAQISFSDVSVIVKSLQAVESKSLTIQCGKGASPSATANASSITINSGMVRQSRLFGFSYDMVEAFPTAEEILQALNRALESPK